MLRCNSKRVWRRSSWQKLNGKSRSKINIARKSLWRTKGNLHQVPRPSGATNMEVKTLLRELARVYEKDIDDNYDMDWEV